MNKYRLFEIIESIAPLYYQEEWDHCGIQIDCGDDEIHRVLISMDMSSDLIYEAMDRGCELIITHHPLLFSPAKTISKNDLLGSYIIELIQAGISVYSSHTAFDSCEGGNNDYILQLLGCRDITGLSKEGPVAGCKVGVFPEPLSLERVAEILDEKLEYSDGMKVVGDPDQPIQSVAICTGAGGEFYQCAIDYKVDLFISGEIKHHEAINARENGLAMIEAGHFGTEWLFARNLAEKLRSICGDEIEIIEADSNVNPYSFY